MSRHSSELTDRILLRCYRNPKPPPTGVPNRFPTARCLKAFCGCSVVARAGKILLPLAQRVALRAADGIWLKAWRALLRQLDAQGLDWAETFADGSFAPAKKGGTAKPPTKWIVVDGQGLPLGNYLDRRCAEVTIEPTLERVTIPTAEKAG